MTWMLIRLVLSLAFVGLVLWFAARVAKKRGLGGGGAHGLIEVVARQRMGRSSSVNVVRIGDVVLVVGATEEQVTLLAEVDNETIDAALREREDGHAPRLPARAPRPAPAAHDHDPYEGPGYEEQSAAEQAYDAAGSAEHGDGHADHGHDGRRAGGHHSEHRPSGGVHRPAAAPRPSNGPLAGSVFDKSGWGTFVNELRERTVRRP
jgi:flagellar protein FliO/FliZ